MIEHDENTNLYGYYYRMYEKNTNNLQWLTNWWLAEHEDGQKKLKELKESKISEDDLKTLGKDDYHKLMERGVKYIDLKKGLWITDTDFHTHPMAILDANALVGCLKSNAHGELEFDNNKVAKAWVEKWKALQYMPITSVSERPLNFYLLTNLSMPDMQGHQEARKNDKGEEEWSRIPNSKEGLQLLGNLSGHLKPTQKPKLDDTGKPIMQAGRQIMETLMDTRKPDIYGKQANDIRTSYMQNHYMLVPRDLFLESEDFRSARSSGGKIGKLFGSKYPELLQMPGGFMGKVFGEEKYREKIQKHVGGFIEEVSLGATYYNSLRLQSWFETQARMRTALDDFNRSLARSDSDFVSDSWKEAEKTEGSARKKYESLLNERNEAQQALNAIMKRAHTKAELKLAEDALKVAKQAAKNAENAYKDSLKAWKQNKDDLEADRNMFRLKQTLWDYYQVSERASMRDPRAGSTSVGTSQPFPTGYHTGQQMYEPVEAVFGFGILPDQDALHRFTYRLAYRVNYSFVTHTRGAYGMLAGYPVRSDIYEGPPTAQNYAITEALRTLFKPGGSWISTNWRAPYVREMSEYTHPLQHKHFLGIGIAESAGTYESKMMPLTFKAPGSTDEHEAAVRFKMLKEGKTKKEIDTYLAREDYAFGETAERKHKRLLQQQVSDELDENGQPVILNKYKQPWYVKIPIVKDVLGETYYSIINRTGDKYTAHGERMRDYEFYTMSYRNYEKAFPPGMNFLDWQERQHLAPRLASYALSFGSLARNAGTLQLALSKEGGRAESYASLLRRDANADVTVATMNLISLAASREHEIRIFSPFQFTPTIIAMSPGWGATKFIFSKVSDSVKGMKGSGPLTMERAWNYMAPAFQKNWYENRVQCSNGHLHLRGTGCPHCQALSARGAIMEEIEEDHSATLKEVHKEHEEMAMNMRKKEAALAKTFHERALIKKAA
ncbi:Uncharacterised protein [Candidatus Anstonella stagnisolia]|nr:Uncharacterised protein [Candidatus Anstonella stagnisolia]